MLKHMEFSIARHLQKKKGNKYSFAIKEPLQIQQDNNDNGNRNTDYYDDDTASSTYAAAPSSSASQPSLPTMNCFSEAGFLLNSSITLSVGYFGVFGTNAVDDILSQQYPNLLLTPSSNGLIMWCILFASQFLYIIVQSYRPYESQLVIKGVQYSFFWASFFQIGWILSTSFDVIWLSTTFVTLCLICSTAIVIRQSVYLRQYYSYVQDLHELKQARDESKIPPSFFDNGSEADTTQNSDNETDDDTRETFKSLTRSSKLSNGRSPLQFWIVQFPFLAYCGVIWTIFLTMVQVVLIRYREEWEDWLSDENEDVDVSQVEYFIVLGCICFLGVIGILSFCYLNNGIIPMVWSWYLIGIYFELNAPAMALLERFPQATIDLVRYEAGGVGAGLLFVSIIACVTRSSNPLPARSPVYPGKATNDDDDDDDTAKSSNGSNDSTTSYVRQEDIESQRESDDKQKKKRPDMVGVIAPSSSDESLSRPYHI